MSTLSDDSSPESPNPVLLLTLKIPSFISKSKVKGKLVEKSLPIVPSWNAVLGLEHWGRDKMKKEIQAAFLCALRACAADSLTRTTSARSTLSTAADTLACFLKTAREQRASKQRNARLEKKKLSTPSLKSLPSAEPEQLPPAAKPALPDPGFF